MTTSQWHAMLTAIKQHRSTSPEYGTAFSHVDGRELIPEASPRDHDEYGPRSIIERPVRSQHARTN